jgi:Suppressor of fused protein (SUFU)
MTASLNWGEAFFDHYVKYLGSPIARSIFRQSEDTPSIQILQFKNVFPQTEVFCSLGTSHYSSILGRISEVTLPVTSGARHVDKVLANCLFSLIQQQMKIGWGIALDGLDLIAPDFVKVSEKTALYFTHPFGFPHEFCRILNGSDEGNIYMAIFISRAEFNFFCDRGAAEFESLLESKNVDPFQWDRRSCV